LVLLGRVPHGITNKYFWWWSNHANSLVLSAFPRRRRRLHMKSRSASSNDMVGSSKNRAKSLKKHQEEEVPQDHNDLFSQPLFMSRPPASTFPNLHNQPYSFSSLNQPAALSTTPRGFSSQPQLPSYTALEKHKVEDPEGEAEERRGESAALLLPEEEELRPIPVPPRPDNISRPAAANVHPPTALQSQAAAASYRDCAASLVRSPPPRSCCV